ncbi:zf-HC2 domain-containing protein [Streptomyces sp. NPDC017673]|uniref:zf-HC2 domain-containing protein n=1 Tax=unclassified Streptomyces TaxID=2593676 RepID=UPI0037A9CC80
MTPRDSHPWHVPDDQVTHYAEGSLPDPDAWSLEKHVEDCARCASRVSAAVAGTAAGPVLAAVRAAVLESAPGAVGAKGTLPGGATVPQPAPGAVAATEPAAGRASGPESARAAKTPAPGTAVPARPSVGAVGGRPVVSRLARLLWAAGPAVRGAWLPAVLGVAVAALALSYGAGFPGARALLLAIAPVVPVAGVALSYGPHADPLHEVTAATPGGGLRLALTRTVAVLAVSLPLLTLTGLLLPASGAPAAAAWLLPGLALALASLALASFVGCRAAAGVTGGGWLCAVLAPVAVAPGGAATLRLAEQLSRCLDGVAAQSAWAAAAVLSATLLTARRPAYDRPLRP